MKHKAFVILTYTLLLSLNSMAQYSTSIINKDVKSLEVAQEGVDLSYPIINLNSSARIAIDFDILSPDVNQLSYSIAHCDVNWQKSDLSSHEYLKGFDLSYIDNYEYSEATSIDYIHYKLNIPNDDIQLTLSGNYAITIINEDNGDSLLTACFSLYEDRVNISGAVSGISSLGKSGKSQQVNFAVSTSGYNIRQPLAETVVVVKQNYSDINKAISRTPTYIRQDQLLYEQNTDFSFLGGGEYRVFESSSLKYAGLGLMNIQFFDPLYHVTVKPGNLRGARAYEFDNDINGMFYIRRQESEQDEAIVEADYMMAHFSLPMKDPILDGKVYVSGGFTYSKLDKSNQMTYNFKTKAYEAHLLLKQGYYNYRYHIVSNRDGKVYSEPIEMDAYQTENDYQIFFYHRPMGGRYDKLVGYQVINSLND